MTTHELFRAENLPVYQNRMFPDEQSAVSCPTGDIVLVQDLRTGLIYNATFDPDLLHYDNEYQNEQAHSAVFRKHLEEVATILDRHCHGKTIVEIGCGKGHFLEYLDSLGHDAVGIDPAYEEDNPLITKGSFIRGVGLKGECIVLRHVLEHIWDPVDFLAEIAVASNNRGIVYIEVPCFDWICGNRAWFDIFYEHVNYFRLEDLLGMFRVVHEAGQIFRQQYLYIVADLATLRTPCFSSAVEFPENFLSDLEFLTRFNTSGARQALWGAGAKCMMFAFYKRQAGRPADLAIDMNPAKQGKYLAGSGLYVLSPSQASDLLADGDTVFIMNSNYTDEIVALSGNRYRYIRVDRHELPRGS